MNNLPTIDISSTFELTTDYTSDDMSTLVIDFPDLPDFPESSLESVVVGLTRLTRLSRIKFGRVEGELPRPPYTYSIGGRGKSPGKCIIP